MRIEFPSIPIEWESNFHWARESNFHRLGIEFPLSMGIEFPSNENRSCHLVFMAVPSEVCQSLFNLFFHLFFPILPQISNVWVFQVNVDYITYIFCKVFFVRICRKFSFYIFSILCMYTILSLWSFGLVINLLFL